MSCILHHFVLLCFSGFFALSLTCYDFKNGPFGNYNKVEVRGSYVHILGHRLLPTLHHPFHTKIYVWFFYLPVVRQGRTYVTILLKQLPRSILKTSRYYQTVFRDQSCLLFISRLLIVWSLIFFIFFRKKWVVCLDFY